MDTMTAAAAATVGVAGTEDGSDGELSVGDEDDAAGDMRAPLDTDSTADTEIAAAAAAAADDDDDDDDDAAGASDTNVDGGGWAWGVDDTSASVR
jgi:hypothetical protein